MSVRVNISVGQGRTQRHLEINRLNPEQMKMDGPHRSMDDIANYEVIVVEDGNAVLAPVLDWLRANEGAA